MTERPHARLLWLGLAIASSPALVSLARSLRDEATHRYTLLALLLIGLLLLRGSDRSAPGMPRPRAGIALAVAGWAAQLLGAASASVFIAHVGLAVSILGVGFFIGRPAPSTLVLTIGLIPVPGFIHAMGSPEVEVSLGQLSGRALGLLGLPVEIGGPLLQSNDGRFEVFSSDSGILTAICAAEVGWYASLRAGEPVVAGVRRAMRAAGLGLLLQPVLVLLAAASLPLGHPHVGRFLLSHGVPIALAIGVLAREIRRP